jgi:hypothetical protein
MADLHTCGARNRVYVGHSVSESECVYMYRSVHTISEPVKGKTGVHLPITTLGRNVLIKGIPRDTLDIMRMLSQRKYTLAYTKMS